MTSQVLAAYKILGTRIHAANEVIYDGGDDTSKHIKSKTGRLKSQKLAKY